MKDPIIYLSSAYPRRKEMQKYKEQLISIGYKVRACWLNGEHHKTKEGRIIEKKDKCIIDVQSSNTEHLCKMYASGDLRDTLHADIIICFTEPPNSTLGHGGRHVELGISIARKIEILVVGDRENLFHWLPQIKVFKTWEECFNTLKERKK